MEQVVDKVYVLLTVGHPSFSSGRAAMVAVDPLPGSAYLFEYRDVAKKKVCAQLGFPEDTVHVFDYQVLGDCMFVD